MLTFKNYVDEQLVTRKPIKIVRKNWNIVRPGYTIEFNNLEKHPLIPRIQERTNLSLNEIKDKFEKAVDYIIKKNDKGFFKRKSMVEMTMKKSEFKVMIMINPEDNYIRISTVLGMDMPTKNTIKWNLNEKTELEEFEGDIFYMEMEE